MRAFGQAAAKALSGVAILIGLRRRPKRMSLPGFSSHRR
jgi:hypothetical protein